MKHGGERKRMGYLENNIEAMKQYNERLYERASEMVKRDCSDCIGVEKAKNGEDIIVVAKDEKKVCLNSTYDPQYEAERFANKFKDLVDNSLLLFFGMGNGVIMRQILKTVPKNSIIIIYEPDFFVFRKTIECFDVTEIFNNSRVRVFVNAWNDELLSAALETNLSHDNLHISFMESLPKYKTLYPQDYVDCYHQFQDMQNIIQMDINTRVKIRKEFMMNPIRNLEYTFGAKTVESFQTIFTPDMPAILISAGPSLDKNIEVLKKAKGKAFLLAVDSAARYLLNHGVVPDMIVALDFLKRLETFQDERIKKIPLVMLTNFNYKVLEMLEGGRFVYGTSDKKLYYHYFEHMGAVLKDIPQGGSVATYAFMLLHNWGFKKIILVGQDLAYTGDQYYAGQGKLSREAIAAGREFIEVEGNYEPVYTTMDFYSYLKWFEMSIAQNYADEEVINATEGGAKIKGTRIMKLQDAMELYCKEEYDFDSLFDCVEPMMKPEQYQQAFDFLYAKGKELKKLRRIVKTGITDSTRAQELVKRGDFGKEFKKLNQSLDKICKEFEALDMSEFLSTLTADVEIETVLDLYISEKDEMEEMKRLYQKLERNYRNFAEHIDELEETYMDTMHRIADTYQLEIKA